MDTGIQKDESRDTKDHIEQVRQYGLQFINKLRSQIMCHDATKLLEPEKSVFDANSYKLKDLKIGTPEYVASLGEIKTAIDHHYTHSRHHPEHFENGIRGMNLIDVNEMFLNWASSSHRCEDGDIANSIDACAVRFGLDPIMVEIFKNTARDLQMGKKCGRIK